MNGRTRLLRAIALAALVATPVAAGAVEPEWITEFGFENNQEPQGMAVARDGSIFVVGRSTKGGFVTQFDQAGTQIWIRFLPGWSKKSYPYAVATDQDGNAYVAGYTPDSLYGTNKGRADAFVIKLDARGSVLWARQPGTSEYDVAKAIAVAPDGSVIVTGYTEGSLARPNKGRADAWIINFDADGHYQWKRQPGATEYDEATAVATDADSNVYVAARVDHYDNGYYANALLKLDPNGTYLWKRAGNLPPIDPHGPPGDPYGVAVGPDQDIVIAGEDGDAGGAPYAVQFGPDGRKHWTWTSWERHHGFAWGVAINGVGRAYVVGATKRFEDSYKAFLAILDPAGNEVDASELNRGNVDVFAHAVAINPKTQEAFVAGTILSYRRGFLAKYPAATTP